MPCKNAQDGQEAVQSGSAMVGRPHDPKIAPRTVHRVFRLASVATGRHGVNRRPDVGKNIIILSARSRPSNVNKVGTNQEHGRTKARKTWVFLRSYRPFVDRFGRQVRKSSRIGPGRFTRSSAPTACTRHGASIVLPGRRVTFLPARFSNNPLCMFRRSRRTAYPSWNRHRNRPTLIPSARQRQAPSTPSLLPPYEISEAT